VLAMFYNLFEFETKAGDPIPVKGGKIIPFARIFRLKIPGIQGGVIWNRPSALLVIDDDGQEMLYPIHDETRRLQLGLLGAGLLAGILISVWYKLSNRRRRDDDEC
jgi:hypothetical protein